MDSETSYKALPLPVFDGENYHIWAARMEAYLEANDLWEAVEEDYEVLPLSDNPTMAQIKNHKERKTRKSKARATLFAAVSEEIFTRIMTIKSAFEIWNFLKTEYEGDERIRGMQALNLIREFEMQKMKESETIKEYANKLISIANKVRLLGSELSDSRIVQKILVTVPERFEATITSLENTKDMLKLTVAELVNAMQAQEQRRMIRSEGSVEGALQAKLKNYNGGRNEKRNQSSNTSLFSPCPYCKKNNHTPDRCWWRPDVKCHKCGQLGHVERICKAQHQGEAKAVEDQTLEEQLFVASCFATNTTRESWLIDSGCTNHMTYDRELFNDLDETTISKVRIGNGALIEVKGKGTVAIESLSGLKLISDVLYVPKINQNLLSVTQLLENGYKVLFEDKKCVIKDANNIEMVNVQMKGKSFALDLINEEQHAAVNKEGRIQVGVAFLHHPSIVNSAGVMSSVDTINGNSAKSVKEPVPGESLEPKQDVTEVKAQVDAIWEQMNKGVSNNVISSFKSKPNSTAKTTTKKRSLNLDAILEQIKKKAEPEIFVGYSSSSKVYRIYLPQSNKVIVSRDVKFLESNSWNWEDCEKFEFQEENEDVDDETVRGTRSLSDIYQRCNVAVMEPEGYDKVRYEFLTQMLGVCSFRVKEEC
jgi:predicted aspartyl protease